MKQLNYKSIFTLIEEPMDKIENALMSYINSDIPKLKDIVEGIVASGGKRVRPMMLVLSAGMCGYFGELTTPIGAIIEHVHTASLLHDDVIDEAVIRRNRPSANSVHGNAVTILAGDYLYTNAFLNMIMLDRPDIAKTLTFAVSKMSEGEIFQLVKTGDTSITMDEYKRIIYGKTGALFTAATECGALLGSPEKVGLMTEYGKNVGYAFQMQDDMLDYFGTESIIGKKPGTDLHEKKVTLPVILLLNAADSKEREAITGLFLSNGEISTRLAEIRKYFDKYNIIDKSTKIIQEHTDIAMNILNQFPVTDYREAMKNLTNELSKRKL